MIASADITVVRELAKQYAAIAAKPVQAQRRDLWRRHNGLQRTRPLIYLRGGSCWHEIINPQLTCQDPFWRSYEFAFRMTILLDQCNDDSVVDPWITAGPIYAPLPGGPWGLAERVSDKTDPHGSYVWTPAMQSLDDIEKLVVPRHQIDEAGTASVLQRVREAVGDIVPVVSVRRPRWWMWTADISTCLGKLRGIEQVMYDMMDNPAGLHRLLAFMRDGILKAHQEAEDAGDWRLCDHQNQAMPYAAELADPSSDPKPVTRKELWGYAAAQEMTLIGPQQHWEFMLQYQLPILARFGLTAYGCCEDLTGKIDILRRVPNLRRIAIAPRANVRKCAEQIGGRYVFSYRPNPAQMVCCGWDEARVRQIVTSDLEAARANGCHADVTLKDAETVEGDASRLIQWTRVVREIVERF